jgi:hypothetical protein
MKRIIALGLIFVGLWSMTYFINRNAFGNTMTTSIGFAILAAITTAGIGLLCAKSDTK